MLPIPVRGAPPPTARRTSVRASRTGISNERLIPAHRTGISNERLIPAHRTGISNERLIPAHRTGQRIRLPGPRPLRPFDARRGTPRPILRLVAWCCGLLRPIAAYCGLPIPVREDPSPTASALTPARARARAPRRAILRRGSRAIIVIDNFFVDNFCIITINDLAPRDLLTIWNIAPRELAQLLRPYVAGCCGLLRLIEPDCSVLRLVALRCGRSPARTLVRP